jgi:hypothetical protein
MWAILRPQLIGDLDKPSRVLVGYTMCTGRTVMGELVKAVFAAPLATLFIVAGMLFLLIAVAGNIHGKMEPGATARIFSGILGLMFLGVGLIAHGRQLASNRPTAPAGPSASTIADQPADAPHMPKAVSTSSP